MNVKKTFFLVLLFLIGSKLAAQNFNGGIDDGHASTGLAGIDASNFADSVFIENVSSGNADGCYRSGEIIQVEVTFSSLVFVSGVPRIHLETGETDASATYTSGSGSNTLIFSYTIGSNESTSDLGYKNGAIDLSSSAIIDLLNEDVNPNLPPSGNAGSLSFNKDLVVSPPLSATIDLDPAQNVLTNSLPVNYLLTFNNPATGVSSANFALSGTAGASNVTVSGSGATYTISVNNVSNDGTILLELVPSGISDDCANTVATISVINNEVQYDSSAPVAEISSTETGPTTLSSIPFTVLFSEPVQGFTEAAITVSNGTISGFAQELTDERWSGIINASAAGNITIAVIAGSATDYSGNPNLASNVFSIGYVINNPPEARDQEFDISLSSEEGSVIGTILASDPDNDDLSFSIVDGNTDNAFSIDPFSGELSCIAATETTMTCVLTIEITDNGEVPQSTLCKVTINILEENEFSANNILTPDESTNKYWLINNHTIYKDYELIIRTGAGQIVYQTINYQNDWNGTFNGKALPSGTYYYTLMNKTKSRNYSGFVHIVRR